MLFNGYFVELQVAGRVQRNFYRAVLVPDRRRQNELFVTNNNQKQSFNHP